MAFTRTQSDPAVPLLVLLATILVGIGLASFASASQSHNAATFARNITAPVTFGAPRAVDGDSFAAVITLWPDLTINTHIRIAGIDAPELRGRCEAEKRLALEAKEALQFLLERRMTLQTIQRDKFGGRFVASVTLADGSDLAQTLIASGYARAYDGGKRKGWCSGKKS
jgi:micrococcal nuclease